MLPQTFILTTLVLLSSTRAFKILHSANSRTHQDITMAAVLQKTAEVCRDQQGGNTTQPVVLSVESVAGLCLSPASTGSLRFTIDKITLSNIQVDIRHMLDPHHHFDDESFSQARALITEGLATVQAGVRMRNYESARQQLGAILHTLQDFYSHSNWIEMGYRTPYTSLIRSNLPLMKIADKATPTCSSCTDNCMGNILDSIISKKILTSGYFSLSNGNKPAGKCSHGGRLDITSNVEPKGGINKDQSDSSHGQLHSEAADVSIDASKQLLQEIRVHVGDVMFLRLMGIFQTSSALCLVIDTSAGMASDITEIKRVTSSITDAVRGSVDEPSAYILVPFRGSDFGPVIKTSDSKEFLKQVQALSAGGGEGPGMSLSALWLALAGSPMASKIFLFTHSQARDVGLQKVVLALMESTASTVNFMLTDSTSNFSSPGNQLYRDLALASGGQAMEISRGRLLNTSSIIVESFRSEQVTIFQTARDPGKWEEFSFVVDPSVRNVIIDLTDTRNASSPDLQFTITAPSGEVQSSRNVSGSLGQVQTLGNSKTIRIKSNQPGVWNISVSSDQPYTLRVRGQSSINFKFDFVEETFGVITGRPRADKVILLLSLLGSNSSAPTEVALVDASNSEVHPGTLEPTEGGDYLVTASAVPKEDFYVQVKGSMGSSSSSAFQRQSSTRYRASNISITALGDDGTWSPGMLYSLPFTVQTAAGPLNVSVRNSLQYRMTFSSSQTAGGANGMVNITAPADAAPGSEVIVTIHATSTNKDNDDFNYAVLRLTVSEGAAPPAGAWIWITAAYVGLIFAT